MAVDVSEGRDMNQVVVVDSIRTGLAKAEDRLFNGDIRPDRWVSN